MSGVLPIKKVATMSSVSALKTSHDFIVAMHVRLEGFKPPAPWFVAKCSVLTELQTHCARPRSLLATTCGMLHHHPYQ